MKWLLLFLGFVFFVSATEVKAQSYSSPSNTGSSNQTVMSTPAFFSAGNAFNYTPLPVLAGSPAHDISESSPLSANRTSAQVDDSITFSVAIRNIAPYPKMLQDVCFESTDGNFGCQWGINLAPQQTFSLNNVGRWTSGGYKNVWITWSQDGVNYYQPQHAFIDHIFISD